MKRDNESGYTCLSTEAPKLETSFGKSLKICYNTTCLIRGIERDPSAARGKLAPPRRKRSSELPQKSVRGSIS